MEDVVARGGAGQGGGVLVVQLGSAFSSWKFGYGELG